MTLPAKVKTWTISANNRIPFVSLVNTMGNYLLGVKNFLNANGYTVKSSSNGTAGAGTSTTITDGVDHWTTAADASVRGTSAAAAQSWMILQDGNGVWILLTYQGAGTSPTGDDIARISFSPGALFVLAGTPTNQPTATDEQVVTSAVTLINATASQDRSWFGWVDIQSKLCRFAIARNQIFVGSLWGIELVASVVTGAGTSWTPPVWGFALVASTDYLTNGATVGKARPVVSSVGISVNCLFSVEQLGNMTSHNSITNQKVELQGASGFPVIPLGLGSATAGAQGKLGNLYDFWGGRGISGGADGDLYGNRQYIGMAGLRGNSGSLIWPWDGATVPILY
jgi:hypothetical protein